MLKPSRTIFALLALAGAAALATLATGQESAAPQESPSAMRAPAAVPQGASTRSAEQVETEKATPQQQELAREMVSAMYAKDPAAIKQLIAPSTLKCIGKNEDYLDDRIRRQFALPISKNYHLTVTRLPPNVMNATQYATYPMPPTHLMGMEFATEDGGTATVNEMIGQEVVAQPSPTTSALTRLVVWFIIPLGALVMLALGVGYRSIWCLGCGLVVGAVGLLLLIGNPIGQGEGKWYEVQPCPTALGMQRFARLQQMRAQGRARAKEALARVQEPLKSQLLALIDKRDNADAWKLCMSSLHVDFTTAHRIVAMLAGDEPD